MSSKASTGALGALTATCIAALLQVHASQAASPTGEGTSANGSNEELQQVTVTGSRVITNGNDSPTPLTVVQADELENLTPTTIADALNSLPQFAGSAGQFTIQNAVGSGGGGNTGANQLNLRSLGLTRSLILFDGQRLVPDLGSGLVDVDMIPQMLIQRVDVVTGGVSAVYGSDAISGVVNYVTDRNFNGLKIEADAGISAYNDDLQRKFGIAGGMSLFGGRGHIEGSYNYYSDAGLLISARPDTDYGAPGSVVGSTAAGGTAANPFGIVNGVLNANESYGGFIRSGALGGQSFDTNGVLTPFVHGRLTGQAGVEIGGDGTNPVVSLKQPVTYNQVFGRFDLDLTDTLKWHTEVTANWVYNSAYDFNTFTLNDTYSSTNPFLASSYQATLAAAGQPNFGVNKQFNEAPYALEISNESEYSVNTGLEGKLGSYTWGVDLDYGKSILDTELQGNVNNQRLGAALDAVVNPANGQIVCRATLVAPGADPGCIPLNVFGPTSATQQAINYVIGTTAYTPIWQQTEVNANIAGALFNTWAGPVNTALSGVWRRQSFSATTTQGAEPTNLANCAGINFNCNATTQLWKYDYATGPEVSQTVKEAAFEFDAPLLKDLPLVKALNLNGAVRYTDYNTSGSYTSWKFGVEWHLNNALTFRGTTSRDIAAPTLYDLFRPQINTPVTTLDLLTGQSPSVLSENPPNPNLTAEIGRTSTIGLVWNPTSNLSLSLDEFHITISNAITQVQGNTAVIENACNNSGGTSYYCQFILRPFPVSNTTPANAVTAWISALENIANIETYGSDLEINYSGRALDHRFEARLLGTYQPHIIYVQPGMATVDFGDVAFPSIHPNSATPSVRLTGMLTVGLTDQLTANVIELWRNGMTIDPVTSDVWLPGQNHERSLGITNLNLVYEIPAKWGHFEFFGNIKNLFNTLPPVAISGNGPGSGFALSDDPTGRFYTGGFRLKL